MPLKAIFLDAGNTLIFIDPRVVLPVFRENGADTDQDRFWEAEFGARTRLARRVEEGATGTEPEVWQDYFVDLFLAAGVPEENLERVGRRLTELHAERHLWTYAHPATRPALEELREAGYRLAVISNADGRVEDLLAEVGLDDLFEFVMDSEVEGVAKPDPEIFLRATRRMGVEPGESLYVGDLYPVDVVGARGAGMEAVLLDPLHRLDYPAPKIPSVADLPGFLAEKEGPGAGRPGAVAQGR